MEIQDGDLGKRWRRIRQWGKAARHPIRWTTRVTISTCGKSISRQSLDLRFGEIYKNDTNAGKIFGCDLSVSNYIGSSVFVWHCVTISYSPNYRMTTKKTWLVAFLAAFRGIQGSGSVWIDLAQITIHPFPRLMDLDRSIDMIVAILTLPFNVAAMTRNPQSTAILHLVSRRLVPLVHVNIGKRTSRCHQQISWYFCQPMGFEPNDWGSVNTDI